MEQLRAALQLLEQQLAALRATQAQQGQQVATAFDQILARQVEQFERLSTSQIQAVTRVVAAAGHRKVTLIDPKGLGKPQPFSGGADKWGTWAFKFENYVSAVFGHARKVFELMLIGLEEETNPEKIF